MDDSLMKIALEEAKKARARGDYFFGAVVADGDGILAQGGNRVITKNDSTKHVELEVIQYAVGTRNSRYLPMAVLYTTCFPCSMCATAAYWAGIRKIVYAMTQDDLQAFSKKNGNAIHKYRPSPIRISVEQMKVDFGIECVQVMRDECLEMLYGRKLKVDKKGRLV